MHYSVHLLAYDDSLVMGSSRSVPAS
jgi:hypothetical protein